MKKVLITLLLLIILAISFLVFQNERMANKLNKPLDEPYLTENEINQVEEVYRVKSTYGNLAWPGFGDSNIPVLLYNDKYHFLFAEEKPSPLWKKVESKQKVNYYRKAARDFQAFAVRAGDDWAGSFGTLRKTNKSYYLGLRSELPPVLNKLIPYQFATMSADFHISAIIHEMFHAFQAKKQPDKFNRANFIYNVMERYPYENEQFIELWNKEGEILFQALESTDQEEVVESLSQFIKIREKRRKGLDSRLIEFEKRIEWLEGLAKYAEMKIYELAAGKNQEKENYNYKEGLPYWQQEIDRLKKLGKAGIGDDFRFYLSGMAQARLLDKLGVDWKEAVMQENVFLDDIIKDYLQD